MPTDHNIKFLNIRAYQKLSKKIFHMIINKQIIHTAVSTNFLKKIKVAWDEPEEGWSNT
jgi:hypothetical protein